MILNNINGESIWLHHLSLLFDLLLHVLLLLVCVRIDLRSGVGRGIYNLYISSNILLWFRHCTLRCSMKILYVKEYFLNGWKLWHTWWQRPFNVYLLMRVLQMKPIFLSRLPPKYLRVVHKCRLHSFCYQAI